MGNYWLILKDSCWLSLQTWQPLTIISNEIAIQIGIIDARVNCMALVGYQSCHMEPKLGQMQDKDFINHHIASPPDD